MFLFVTDINWTPGLKQSGTKSNYVYMIDFNH